MMKPCTSGVSVASAAFALVLVAMGACSSDDKGLFGDPNANSGGVGGEGGAMASGSSSSSGSSSASSSSSSSGAGGGGGSANPLCGDGKCNGTETPNTCLKDCPPVCGDTKCEGDETSAGCPQDCGALGCQHDVCLDGDPLVDGCDPCVTMVCAQDPNCCNDHWGGQCVSAASSLCNAGCCGNGTCSGEDCNSCPKDCGTCPPPPTCAHSVCEAGAALNTTDCRDPCIDELCDPNAHPECCQGSPPMWTGECVQYAEATCGDDPCITAVCAQDPSCCSVSWTDACKQIAVTACATTCDCQPHSMCKDGGGTLDPSCDPCVAQVCIADPYCCNNDWDGFCVYEVGVICDIICN